MMQPAAASFSCISQRTLQDKTSQEKLRGLVAKLTCHQFQCDFMVPFGEIQRQTSPPGGAPAARRPFAEYAAHRKP
jgi:hypothetical protein